MLDETADFARINSAKASFDSVYVAPDPRAYFSVLGGLDYSIPDAARPVFRRLAEARREAQGSEALKLVDLGCSYGINAALLKYPLSFADLKQRYTAPALQDVSSEELLELDRHFFNAWPADEQLTTIGIDVAAPAVRYARRAGMLDDGFPADLENGDAPEPLARALADVDMVISTGCVGYVGERSFEQLTDVAAGERTPWIASFVLRMFPYDAIERSLAERGLVTEKLEGATFVQRRFRDGAEQRQVVGSLEAMGIDPGGKEADGLYHAELFVSRPEAEAKRLSLPAMLGDLLA